MGLFSRLLRNKDFNDQESNDSYSKEIDKCRIECALTKSEYQLAELNYYRGHNCYKTFFKYVFVYNIKKIKKVLLDAKKMADNGCAIDFTFVRFYHNNKDFIDIPFEVFAAKNDMKDNVLRRKLWHKANIKRIIINNQTLRNMSDEELEESINVLIEEILTEVR